MKKALSVFLSLLMVITSISVVFTLPASAAVVNYVINENFDSYTAGDSFVNTKVVPDEDGWVSTSNSTIVDPSADSETYGGFAATSGNNVLAVPGYGNAGYVFNVLPTTTYTITVKSYSMVSDACTVEQFVTLTDISNMEDDIKSVNRGAVTDTNDVVYNYQKLTKITTEGSWVTTTYSFTTTANQSKMVVFFRGENWDSSMSSAQKCYFIDDFAISYVAKPTVKAVTYGADTQNGGEAWVVTDVSGDVNENAEITYKARPYDSALFDGFYSVVGTTETKITENVTDNGDGSYTLVRPWSTSEKIIAKFEALAKNYFEDGSGENAKVTAGSSAPADATRIYQGKGGSAKAFTNGQQTLVNTIVQHKNANSWDVRTATREISADNWVGSSYGGIATNDNTYINSVAAGVTAYSGKSAYNVKQASHSVFKVVRGLEKNTDYIVTYYIYQYGTTADFNSSDNVANSTTSYAISGIPTNATTVYMGDGNIAVGTVQPLTTETVVNAWGEEAEVVTNQTRLTQSYIVDGRSILGAWTKHSVTFNTGDFNDVLVNFFSAQGTFIDHISLYEEPEATTPTNVSVSDNGMNAGFIGSVSDVYYEGDTFTATAVGYDNGTFLGWYVNDQKVSESLTYVFTYDSEATYVAKFDALTKNVFEDGSFEGYTSTPTQLPTSGQSASSTGVFVWGTWNATEVTPNEKNWVGTSYGRGYVASSTAVNEIAAGAAPYAGNNVAVGYTGSHAIAKVVPVEQNKTYKLVYYTYSLSANALASGKNHVVGIDMTNGTVYLGTSTNGNNMNFGTDGTNSQTKLTTTYTSFDNQTTGAWVRQEATFNSGDYTNVLVQFGIGASQGLMIDHISVFEVPTAFAPTITIDDGGKNAGIVYDVTEVYRDGDEFSATTMPYENGTFIGFYVGDTKVADEKVVANADGSYTATFTYDEDAVYTAKYTAEQTNIFPDHEDRATNNKVGDSFVGTAAYHWVSGLPVNHTTIDKNLLTAVTTYGYPNSKVSADKVFAGDSSFIGSTTGGHAVYQIVKVEPNTKYQLTYYYYQDSVIHKTSGIYSINLDIAQNTYTDYITAGVETADDLVVHTSGAGYFQNYSSEKGVHQALLASTNDGSFSEVGAWTKMVRTFTSDELGWVAIPFAADVSGTFYVDQVSLVKIPDPMTISMGSATGGHIMVNGAPVDSYEFVAGATATFSIDVTPGNVFVGWFDNATLTGEPVYTATDLSITALEGTTLYPKIIDNNIVVNGDMENLPSGSIESQSSIYGWNVSNREAWFDIFGIKGSENGISPYAGTTMLKVSGRNNADAFWYAANLKKNTTYTVSFKAAFSGEWAEGQSYFTQFAVVSDSQTGREEVRKEFRAYTENYAAGNYKYGIAGVADGWKSYSFTFNSANLEKAKVLLSWTCPNPGNYMYLDDFAITETVNSSVSIETLNPFGESVIGSVAGKAEIIHSSKDGEYFFNGQNGTAKATLKAMPFDNNVFLGWYVGETLVSTDATAEVEFTEATNYVAKFASFGFAPQNNIYNNQFGAGFENGDIGVIANVSTVSNVHQLPIIQNEVADGEGTKTVYTPSWPDGNSSWTGFGKDTYGSLEVVGEKSFEGQYSLAVKGSLKSEAAINRITGLTADTDYTLSFWYFIPEALVDSVSGKNANYLSYVAIGGEDSSSNSTVGYINNDAIVAEWVNADENTFGQWTKYSINFNSGDNTTVYLSLVYLSGGITGQSDTQPLAATNFYMDNFELYARADLNAAAQKAFEISAERGGVAIRAAAEGVPQALRFKARIAKERFTAMTLGADYTVVEYGTLAMNAAYIQGSTPEEKADNLTLSLDENGNKVPYTNGGKTANVGVTYNANTGANKVFAYKDGENDLIFTAALTGIGKNMEGQALADAYRTKFIVRTYAIVELADGTKIVVLDNNDGTYCASVFDVASQALLEHQGGTTILDATTLAAVENIIDICENNDATPDPGVASSYSVTYNPSVLANGTKIENHFINDKVFIDGDKGTHANSAPAYYESDKSIHTYAGNTLTLTTADGYYIESVVISTLEDYPYGDATTSTGVATTEGLATTVTGINSSTFTLTTPADTRITGIVVNYKYGEAPDPIYPEEPDPEDPNTTEVNASDLGLENGQPVVDAAITVDENNMVAVNGGAGTNSNGLVPKFYTSDNTVRAYAGNTLTFTAQASTTTYSLRNVTTSKKISSIILTYGDSIDINATANVGEASYDEENKTLTITGINAREVVISFTAKAFITNIKIITEDIAPCETHTYTDNCDVECNVCYAVRDDAPHQFASDCDTTCECGETREALADHTADPCATACDLCGEAVVPTHKFAGDCDTTCECGETREATAEHTYVDGACSVCGAIEPVSCSHEYDNNCDAECNICGFVREDITHTYKSDCDTKCEYCDETREALAEHTYEFVCSTECTACGATREADHDFTNGDCECGEPKPTTVTVNTVFADLGWTNQTKYTQIDIVENIITATAVGGTNTGNYYTNGNNWRIYQGENGKVVITAAAGYVIVSVKFTYESNNGGILKYGDATVASNAVIDINGATATFTVGNSGAATNGQARISAIEVVYDIVPECAEGEHVYANDCDADCDVCGKVRDEIPHAFDSDCDTTCDCGATREALAEHTTDDACKIACDLCGEAVTPTHTADDTLCDTTCSNCGATVEATEEHSFDDGCDTECNNCGATREADHEDEVLCDTTCSNCGAEVEATADHLYDDDNDAICNNCGFERVLESQCDHTADAELCDTTCSVCGAEVEATADHTWTNACDTTCDVCDTVREQAHVDTILCDTVCSTCGAEVEATADHAYTDNCDADCNNCGAIRTVTHDDAVLCDETCSNCGATVEATAEHNYVDGVCDACGVDKPTSTTVNVVIADYASAHNWTNGVQYSNISIDEYISISASTDGNNGKYYTSGNDWRMYQANNGTVTFTASNNKIIISIKVTYTAGNSGLFQYNGVNVASGEKLTVNASSVVLVVAKTGTGTNGQAKITAIEVVYGDPCSHANDQIKCDTVCSECGMAVEATEDHTFDDGCDTDCNLCDATREANHEDEALCDTKCSNCGATVEATAEHTYDDNADAICNDCGFERIVGCDHAEDDTLCDTTCSVCGADVEATADHTWTNACDTTCDVCDTVREQAHVDNILCDTVCSTCGAEVEATAEHNYVDGVCSNCGAEEPAEQTLAQFTMGANGSASHLDGSSKTSYSETNGGYTLSITGGNKMYTGAIDAKGNSCIKLGTGSAAGGFTFTVAENVTKVIIYIGGYKATAGKLTINGTSYTTTNNSNDGAYNAIEIDTSTTKTVTLTTVSGGYRAMVNGIDFVGTPA